jgi:uncharacterized membrane protein
VPGAATPSSPKGLRFAADALTPTPRQAFRVGLRERVEQHVMDFAATLSHGDRATFVHGLVIQGNLRVPAATAKPTPT